MKRHMEFALATLLVIASMTATPRPARSAEPGPWPVEKAAAWSRASSLAGRL